MRRSGQTAKIDHGWSRQGTAETATYLVVSALVSMTWLSSYRDCPPCQRWQGQKVGVASE